MDEIVYFDAQNPPHIVIAVFNKDLLPMSLEGQQALAQILINISCIMTNGDQLAQIAEANRLSWEAAKLGRTDNSDLFLSDSL